MNDKFNIFGKSYSVVGEGSSDLILKTKGNIKILWGNKFIDLIKDGKINSETNFIYKSNSVGVKNGIYVIDKNNSILAILKINDIEIDLNREVGNTYISFQKELNITSEQKYKALVNIGFIYKDINSISEDSLQNGIIYVESELKLFIVLNGFLKEFSLEIPSPYPKLFIIAKDDNSLGSLVIKGKDIYNSLAFDSFKIYSDYEMFILDSNEGVLFKVKNTDILKIDLNNTIINNNVISDCFLSIQSNRFKLFILDFESTLEVDNLLVRNGVSSENNIYPAYWFYKNNVILEVLEINEFYKFKLKFENLFKVNDSLYIYYNYKNELGTITFTTLVPFVVTEINNDNSINVLLKDLPPNFSSSKLCNLIIFLVGSESNPSILRIINNNIDILDSSNFGGKISSRFGNLDELQLKRIDSGESQLIEGHGVYSDCGVFKEVQYINNYNLPISDNSTRLVSTEWIHLLFPKGSIIMFSGKYPIPNGWLLCDGTNNTPDLTDKFVINESEYLLIYIMKIV